MGKVGCLEQEPLLRALVLVSMNCPVEGVGVTFKARVSGMGGVVLREILRWGQAHGVSYLDGE